MKIAYLMPVHLNPVLMSRLIAALSCKDSDFFIHVDRKSVIRIRHFSGITGDNIFLSQERIPVYYGGFSQVEATLLLLREATSRPRDYDYFILLGSSHYPLRSKEYIHRFFENNRGSEFISMARIPDDAHGLPLSKIDRIYFEEDEPVRRFLFQVLARVGLAQRDHRKCLGALEAYGGSADWALTRGACRYIIEFVQSNEAVMRFFRHTPTPDEMFFHTILGNSPFRFRIRRNVTYIHWPPTQNRPSLLNNGHVEQIESSDPPWIDDEWGSGEALFARKFSDDRLELVDRIDSMIRQRQQQGQAMRQSGVFTTDRTEK